MENRKVPLKRHIKQNSCYQKIISIVYQHKFLSQNNNLKKALASLTWYGLIELVSLKKTCSYEKVVHSINTLYN